MGNRTGRYCRGHDKSEYGKEGGNRMIGEFLSASITITPRPAQSCPTPIDIGASPRGLALSHQRAYGSVCGGRTGFPECLAGRSDAGTTPSADFCTAVRKPRGSIRLGRGLAPPDCQTCSAYQRKPPAGGRRFFIGPIRLFKAVSEVGPRSGGLKDEVQGQNDALLVAGVG